MCYACLLQTGQSELLNAEHVVAAGAGVELTSEVRPVPTSALISASLSNFTRTTVAADGVLALYMNISSGPVAVGGGPFGAQTIQALSIDSGLQEFYRSTVARLDSLIDLDFVTVSSQAQGEVNLFLDREIVVDSGGTTLGIALSNSSNRRNWWELVLNGPALVNQPDYLRYALIHELGHALGLEHPFDNSDGDVFVSANSGASAFPEETVMAYRQPLGGSWPTWYADADIEAMVQLWGAEVQQLTNGVDVIQGRDYSEFFSAAQGDDIIHGGGGNDQIRGGRGNDWINGNTGNDTIYGDLGHDTVRGGKGDDSVFGGGGNDLVTGDLGNDRLDGGDGDDELSGGSGADVFVLSAGADRIKDFDWQAGDRLQVAASVGYRLAAGSGGLLVQTALGSTVLEGVALGSFNTAAITLV
jgi:hypothetical protein